MRPVHFILMSPLLWSLWTKAQFQTSYEKNVPFEKEFFSKEQRPQLKEAIKEIGTGDALCLLGRGRFKDAIKHYFIAEKLNPNNALLNYKIGRCYLYGSTYKLKSISYLEKADRLDEHVKKDVLYLLAQADQINADWDRAIANYKKFQKTFTGAEPGELTQMVRKKILECQTGKKLMADPVRAFIDNVGEVINSKYPEYGVIISADESIMMFTSRRPTTTGGGKDPNINEYFEDIYVSRNIGGAWTQPQNMGEPVNSKGHDATINLSPDGQKLLIYQDDKGDGNIYECDLNGEVWSKPRKLSKTVNSEFHEPSASFSFNGKKLFFVSNRPEGQGGLDIYQAVWDGEKDRWGVVSNLGPVINTKYAEEGVFMHPDGKTLYFSSQGHNTMGGFDIFKSIWSNGKWGKPENLGHPINSPDDDVFFALSGSGRHGYYSSFKTDGFGEKDLYRITFLGPEKPLMLNTEDNLLASIAAPVKETVVEPVVTIVKTRLTILTGTVKDAETKEPLEARMEVVDNSNGSIISDFESNSSTGKFLVSLPSGKNYGLAAKAEGYLFHSENFNIPKEAAFMKVHKDIFLKKIKVGQTIVLRNIFFDYGKYSLRAESHFELGRVFKLMADNPSIKVEMSGHTDSKGSDTFNQKLSENRAKSVVEFLVKLGVAQNRLVFAGYGETQSIATNDTEEGRQENRRTEFKIIEK